MKKMLVLLIILMLSLGLVTAGGAQETLKIGGLLAFTGGLAPYGPPIFNGAALGVKHINEAGGLLGGHQFVLIQKDTATAPAVGRDAAAKLIQINRVLAIVGALSSGVTFASSSITIDNRIVLISPSSTSPMITDLHDNDFVFRTVLSDAFQGLVQGRLAAGQLGYKSAAVIYVNNPYGKGLALIFNENFQKWGGGQCTLIPYEENKPSYRGEVEKAISINPDVLNIIGYPVDGNKMLVHAVELGYQGAFLFPDGMKGEAVAAGPASKYIEGSWGTAPGTRVVPAFEEAYIAQFGSSTVPYRTEAYDAAVLLALAIQKTGLDFLNMSLPEQRSVIKENLRAVANPPGIEVTYGELDKALKLLEEGKEINYQGVSGPITFDENGDVAAGSVEIWRIIESKVSTVTIVSVGG